MATCPRCHNALSEGHHCRPIWIKRLRRRVFAAVLGVAFGATIQALALASAVPIMGAVIGGLLFFGLSEVMTPE